MNHGCHICGNVFSLGKQRAYKYKKGQRIFMCSLPCQIVWMNRCRSTGNPDTPEELARQAVYRATKRGELQRPNVCELCNEKSSYRIEAHHYLGYERRLDVQWLCIPCHAKVGIDSRPRGEKHANAKLKELDVLEIKQLLGEHSVKALAGRYKVGCTTIRRIRDGETWRHVLCS